MSEEKIKEYYDMGLYTDDNLKSFVDTGYISAVFYKEWTGKKYKA